MEPEIVPIPQPDLVGIARTAARLGHDSAQNWLRLAEEHPSIAGACYALADEAQQYSLAQGERAQQLNQNRSDRSDSSGRSDRT